MSSSTKKIVYLGLMVGLAMGLHAFEAMLPLPYLFPGAKLGLANIISLFVIVNFGVKEGVLVAFLRVVLGSLIGGTFLSIPFFLSFSGGIVSAISMSITYTLFKKHLSFIGISIIGALTHNITQVLVAAFLVDTFGIVYYLPYLLFFAIPTGFFVGLVTYQLQKYWRVVS